MERHTLSNIDLDRRTAVCRVCGPTEIYVPITRTRAEPRVSCIVRAKELKLYHEARQNHIRKERQAQPGWKPRHALSEINPDDLTAVCAICGPTEIRKNFDRGYTRYDCATKIRDYVREYRRTNYVGRPSNPHALSEVNEEKRTAMCAKCGPVRIEIWQGKKKINRGCINARNVSARARRNRRKAQNNEAL
jgi:hypothetical protein